MEKTSTAILREAIKLDIHDVLEFPFNFEDLKNSVRTGNFVAGKCIQKLGARNGLPNREELISEFFK